jgi:hypothetical protein
MGDVLKIRWGKKKENEKGAEALFHFADPI